VTVEARSGVITGISATDRAHTLRTLVDVEGVWRHVAAGAPRSQLHHALA
jgi:3,4-dihydroxy-2-butanone 4-phosphate synthase